jgi:POT family proton-dependent oligopeptide transporter
MKSFVMGLYLLVAIALGNILTAFINGYLHQQKVAGSPLLVGAAYYWFFTGFMVLAAVAFVIWSQFYKGSTYIQGDATSEDAVVQ